ncbi:patellin-3-like [Syzygium oleosum]|uniref:patellin-3-like n=1 Tax=Syzygium oleosum TaxID=219896 RepID=UPI0024B9DA35|nr:patellin-3-like [Syzygium oleosum]
MIGKYISPEQVPVQYGGLSVDYCDCDPEFTVSDPATEMTVKPGIKQIVEIIIYEKCVITWELRVVGWEVSYGAEFVPNSGGYSINIQKPKKMSPADEPVAHRTVKVSELGKVLLTAEMAWRYIFLYETITNSVTISLISPSRRT